MHHAAGPVLQAHLPSVRQHRQPSAESVLGQDGMRNVICINGLAESAVETDAPDADAAIVDPVITFDPPDKLGLARQTLVAPVTARHLQAVSVSDPDQ